MFTTKLLLKMHTHNFLDKACPERSRRTRNNHERCHCERSRESAAVYNNDLTYIKSFV